MPYKLERLKPIYLFVIFTLFFSLSFTIEKNVFSLITTSKYKEFSLGDEYATDDYVFNINWDDDGHKDERPTSLTFDLYKESSTRVENQNGEYDYIYNEEIVDTITLTSANEDSVDSNKWIGVFHNKPTGYSNDTYVSYRLSEVNIDNYVRQTSTAAVCIRFGNNVFNGEESKKIKIAFFKSSGSSYVVKEDDSEYFYYNDLKDQTICMPYESYGGFRIYFIGDIYNLNIESVFITSKKNFAVKNITDYSEINVPYDSFRDEYPNNSDKNMAIYWTPNNFPVGRVNTTLLYAYNKLDYPVEVIWDDYGFENNRPDSITYNLYNVLDENTIVSSITLSSINESNNSSIWIGSFKNVPNYNADKSKAEYIIKQDDINGYNAVYSKKKFYFIQSNVDIIKNQYNMMNYKFEIHWDDVGLENNRPPSINYQLFDSNNMNTVLQTVTLSSLNEDNDDNNKWIGYFNNIPRYDTTGKQIKYIIKQEDLEDYSQRYDITDFNSLCVNFGEVDFDDYTEQIEFGILKEGLIKSDDNKYTRNDLSNKTICLPAPMKKIHMFLSIYSNRYSRYVGLEQFVNLNVQDIYPSQEIIEDNFNTQKYDYENLEVYSNDNYPNRVKRPSLSYIWGDKKNNFAEANIIKNKNIKQYFNLSFDKYWEDEGFENYRPSSSNFKLYAKDNPNRVIQSITLSNENIVDGDNSHWKGEFKNLLKYDAEGNEIFYTIVEEDHDNYINSRDSSDGISIKFNENYDTMSYMATFILMYDRDNNEWYNYEIKDNTIGLGVYGKTIDLNINNERWVKKSMLSTYKRTKNYSDERAVVELVGAAYPETYHPFTLGEEHCWHYRKTISNHTFDFYMVFDSPSWNLHYGVKIDDIFNNGHDNILTSTINFRTMDITKKWEDDNNRLNKRPNSTMIDIYNSNDMNHIIKTVTLTMNDAISDNEWKKTIENLPKYDDNSQIIEYTIVERPIDDYYAFYDYDDYYNSLAVTFSDDTLAAGLRLSYIASNGNDVYMAKIGNDYYNSDSASFGNTVGGHTIVFSSRDISISFLTQADRKIKITNIEPVHSDYDESEPNNPNYGKQFDVATGNNYLDTSLLNISYTRLLWKYKWTYSPTPKRNATIIVNKLNLVDYDFEKRWDDIGYEDSRPERVKVSIYKADNDELVKDIYLTSANLDSNNNYIWKGSFDNIPKYNIDGNEIKYYIKEEKLNGYLTTYDKKEINALCINFYDESLDPNDSMELVGSIIDNTKNKYKTYGENTATIYLNLYNNRDLCIPVDANNPNVTFYFNILNYDKKMINKIYPAYIDKMNYYLYPQEYSNSTNKIYGEEYNSINLRYTYDYSWKPVYTPFVENNIIINTSNVKSEKVVKRWMDVGNENSRPSSVRFDIYNILDENTVVSTIRLTENDENPSNKYEWIGSFKNLPRYNEDGTRAKYTVKEQELDKYKTEYRREFNSICMKFGDNVFNGNTTQYIQIFVRKQDGSLGYYMLHNENNQYGVTSNFPPYYASDLRNKELCVPVYGNDYDFFIVGNTANLDIKSIYKGYKKDFYYTSTYTPTVNVNLIEFEDDELPNITEKMNIHYTLHDDDFDGGYIITNYANMRDDTYIKEFNDLGYEYNRPSEIVFGLYLEDDPVPKEMVTVNTSSCTDNTCEIYFKYVKDKDSDGNPINYIIKEISDYGYTVTYQDDKVINTANPVDVKFIKEDINGKPLRGAKLAIYNKSGDKLKEFTSSNRELTIKLIPSEYIIKELEAPEGYERVNDIHIVVNSDGTYTQDNEPVETIRIVNEPIKEKYNINLKKTLKTNEEKEFEFEISIVGYEGTLEYDGDRTGILTFTDGKAIVKLGGNQTITIKNIPVNSKYEIRELGNDYLVTIVGETNGVLNRNETIEFINVPRSIPGNGEEPIPEEKDVPTPITGVLNILSYIAGIILLIGSIFLIIYSKKQLKKS